MIYKTKILCRNPKLEDLGIDGDSFYCDGAIVLTKIEAWVSVEEGTEIWVGDSAYTIQDSFEKFTKVMHETFDINTDVKRA